MNHEFDAIERLFRQHTPFQHHTTQVGNGDDASVHHLPEGEQLVISTDTAVEGIHWPHDFPLSIAAQRAVCAALSDLAAMGAKPAWLWLAVMAKDKVGLQHMSQGIVQACAEHHIELAGGDTSRSHAHTITATVGGLVPQGRAMLRGAAQKGDEVWLLGDVGLSAAGLEQWQQGQQTGDFVPYFQQINPLYQQGVQLRDAGVRCCIDISDGLLQDARHIAQASHLQIHIHLERIQALPCYQLLLERQDNDISLKQVLNGGEDYALLCTAPQHMHQTLHQLGAQHIGDCATGEGVQLMHHGKVVDYHIKGHDHFV